MPVVILLSKRHLDVLFSGQAVIVGTSPASRSFNFSSTSSWLPPHEPLRAPLGRRPPLLPSKLQPVARPSPCRARPSASNPAVATLRSPPNLPLPVSTGASELWLWVELDTTSTLKATAPSSPALLARPRVFSRRSSRTTRRCTTRLRHA